MKGLLISVCIISVAAFFYFQKPPPFKISSDMQMEKRFIHRLRIEEISSPYGFLQYTQKSKRILNSVDVNNLQKLRCSDGFIRTDQGVFVLEHTRTKELHTRRIKNEGFLEYMRNKEPHLPIGTKILTAKICETGDEKVLLFYSIGSYEINIVDKVSIRRAIASSTNNTTLVDVISPSRGGQARILGIKTIAINKSPDHIRCDQTFQIDKTGSLFTLCTEEGVRATNYTVMKVNLHSGSVQSIERCTNSTEDISRSVCR